LETLNKCRCSEWRLFRQPPPVSKLLTSKHPRNCPPCGPVCIEATAGLRQPPIRRVLGLQAERGEEKERPAGSLERIGSYYNLMIYSRAERLSSTGEIFFSQKWRAGRVNAPVTSTGALTRPARQEVAEIRRSSYQWSFSQTARFRRGPPSLSPRILPWPRCRAARTECRA